MLNNHGSASAKSDEEERLPENVYNKQLLTGWIGWHRKASSPSKLPLVYVDLYTLQTSKNPLEQQLEDVKNLRYLRTGKYSSQTAVTKQNQRQTRHATVRFRNICVNGLIITLEIFTILCDNGTRCFFSEMSLQTSETLEN